MDMLERTVGLIAVGVDRTGILPELGGAAKGAKEFANWLKKQKKMGVKTLIHLFTDANNGSVEYRDIKDAAQKMVDDGGLDLLILYFSGHGIVKNGDDEQVLLSQVKDYPSEAINIASTLVNAKHSNIKHVIIFSDACRNTIDPYDSSLGQIAGSSAFFRKNIVGISPSKVDIFYATEPSQTAKELNNEGFFTKVLLDALTQCPSDICEKISNSEMLVIKSWKLENYLNEQVPRLAFSSNPSFEQTPDIQTTSRDPLFFAYALTPPPKKNSEKFDSKILIEFNSKLHLDIPILREIRFNQPINLDSDHINLEIDHPPSISAPKSRNAAFKDILSKLSYISSLDEIKAELQEANIYEEINEYLELEQHTADKQSEYFKYSGGYHIVGDDIDKILTQSKEDYPFKEIGPNESCIFYTAENSSTSDNSIIVILKSGTFMILPKFQDYIGTVSIKNGLAKSISLNLLNTYKTSSLSLRRACIAAFASNGKLSQLCHEDLFNLTHFIKQDKYIDPTLSIYASYAYTLAGDERNVSSIYQNFELYRNSQNLSIPFDVAFLANKSTLTSVNGIAPLCPMMSLGWSLLDSYLHKDDIHPLILELGKYRLNSEWSTFLVKSNLAFLEAFEKGKI